MNIIFASMKGGVGKSTLARSLAVSLADTKFKVLLADLDSEQGSTIRWAEERLEQDIQPALTVATYQSVAACIKAGKGFDHVVIDLKPRGKPETGELAKQGDLIIIPSGPSLDDLQPAGQTYRRLVNQQGEKALVAICLNRVGSEIESEFARAYLAHNRAQVLDNEIPERRSYRGYMNRGKSLVENLYGNLAENADDVMDDIKRLMEKAAGKQGEIADWQIKEAS